MFKNNTGVAYDKYNRPVFFGLGNEGKKNVESDRTPDWVGWHNVVITQEMVGKTLPVFLAIDAKKAGFTHKTTYSKCTREYGQNKFFQKVINANGVAGFAVTADHVKRIISDFYKRVTK
ncbi:MAG: hypothetical protein GY928_01080 [Colwellia sp.]|nr:hypothetical protein [Colwellia sp.]